MLAVELDRERVSLSLKATQEDPWQVFARTHAIGQVAPGKVTKLVPFGAFVRVADGIEGLVHISELSGKHVELAEQVVSVGEEVFVKVIDIDLERRRISLSLKQANEGVDPEGTEFDPALYGMLTEYDEQGNYKYPEGFDPETNEWREGFEAQREKWEQDYAAAQARWEAHKKQVAAANAAAVADDSFTLGCSHRSRATRPARAPSPTTSRSRRCARSSRATTSRDPRYGRPVPSWGRPSGVPPRPRPSRRGRRMPLGGELRATSAPHEHDDGHGEHHDAEQHQDEREQRRERQANAPASSATLSTGAPTPAVAAFTTGRAVAFDGQCEAGSGQHARARAPRAVASSAARIEWQRVSDRSHGRNRLR